MTSDPIADLLTRIRNASRAGHTKVDVPASKIKTYICKVLKEEGYIRSFKLFANDRNSLVLKIFLKENAISGIERISSPGLRVYKGRKELPRVLSGLGIAIISTSKGIMSSRSAKKMEVGGEVICKVW
ncbi:MAG: 30S ribosomal protein S8 [Oligoflexia bacterium]|nr:30S ribosomal protein S8 [Oligoflexia bacterium]